MFFRPDNRYGVRVAVVVAVAADVVGAAVAVAVSGPRHRMNQRYR